MQKSKFAHRLTCCMKVVIVGLLIGVIVPAAVLGLRLLLGPGAATSDLYEWELVIEDLSEPTGVYNAGDDRLFIVEKLGKIRILENGDLLQQPFLDIEPIVNRTGVEQGLLGLVFDPSYAENGFFYVYYTGYDDNAVHIERYEVSDDPNVADPNSAESVLDVAQVGPEHNGGGLLFGVDDYLYIGLGDSTYGPATGQGTGQRLDDLLGKILRIDVSELPYTIPPDNPFVDTPNARPEIWAYGLRNPWRFAFVPDTGDLFIADVGEAIFEQVNFQPYNTPGLNFGWSYYDAHEIFDTEINPTLREEDVVFPVVVYEHESSLLDLDDTLLEGRNCAIVGGHVYQGDALPDLHGVFLYGDWCSGRVWGLHREGDEWVNEKMMDTEFLINSFGEDRHGEIYLATLQGELWKLVAK